MSETKEIGLLSPEDVKRGQELGNSILAGLNRAILGQEALTKTICMLVVVILGLV